MTIFNRSNSSEYSWFSSCMKSSFQPCLGNPLMWGRWSGNWVRIVGCTTSQYSFEKVWSAKWPSYCRFYLNFHSNYGIRKLLLVFSSSFRHCKEIRRIEAARRESVCNFLFWFSHIHSSPLPSSSNRTMYVSAYGFRSARGEKSSSSIVYRLWVRGLVWPGLNYLYE